MVREIDIFGYLMNTRLFSKERLTELRFEDAWLCSLVPGLSMETYSRVLEVIWQ